MWAFMGDGENGYHHGVSIYGAGMGEYVSRLFRDGYGNGTVTEGPLGQGFGSSCSHHQLFAKSYLEEPFTGRSFYGSGSGEFPRQAETDVYGSGVLIGRIRT
jgi:hypothetical protein